MSHHGGVDDCEHGEPDGRCYVCLASKLRNAESRVETQSAIISELRLGCAVKDRRIAELETSLSMEDYEHLLSEKDKVIQSLASHEHCWSDERVRAELAAKDEEIARLNTENAKLTHQRSKFTR